MDSPKVLTLEKVMVIIALTPVPPQEVSADDAILSRIQELLKEGCMLAPDAEAEVAKHRNNAAPHNVQEAAK